MHSCSDSRLQQDGLADSHPNLALMSMQEIQDGSSSLGLRNMAVQLVLQRVPAPVLRRRPGDIYRMHKPTVAVPEGRARLRSMQAGRSTWRENPVTGAASELV